MEKGLPCAAPRYVLGADKATSSGGSPALARRHLSTLLIAQSPHADLPRDSTLPAGALTAVWELPAPWLEAGSGRWEVGVRLGGGP